MKKQGKADAAGGKSAGNKVILHNDDHTSMDFVVLVLMALFGQTAQEAAALTKHVHETGTGVAGEYPIEIALAKKHAVRLMAKAKGYPFVCTIEGLDDHSDNGGGTHAGKQRRNEPPKGWFLAGAAPQDYSVFVDPTTSHTGTRSVCLENASEMPEGFGTVMQNMHPEEYKGKRLRMSMWVKTKDAKGPVQPWIRVDGPKALGERMGKLLSFDNWCNRQIFGTSDWTLCESVVDVPESATNIGFGIMLCGTGKLWMDNVAFAVAEKGQGVTDCPCMASLDKGPKNLNFED